MATASGGNEGSGVVNDPELWREQQRFYNFLQRYDLHKYHQRFLRMGVRRLTHFKDVTDADLDAVGLSSPEKARLRKKLDENFSVTGKIKKIIAGKSRVFDEPNSDKQAPPTDPTPQEATLIAKEDIKLDKKLGEGAHGTVFEGTWSNKHGSVIVAVKTLYGKEEVHSTFIKEAMSMRALLHEHIIQLYGIVLSSPLMLVQELAPCGDLHSYLQKHGATKNMALFHTYATQIADAMKYLEEKRIVHRDLAARNILLAAEDYLKLSDFGMARLLDEQTGVYNLSNLQSRIPIAWTSLEALTHAKFSSASDVWSYGVTLWEIYSLGAIPWKGLTPIEIRDCLVGGERLGCPERCPREIYHVMTSSWETRAQDRPTFASIYQTLQKYPPAKVRAIKAHAVASDMDNNCLSFQKGDLIFLINKPKQGWLYGMLIDGKMGYFLEDHVTNIVDPIGDIKGKIQAGKAKVTDLPISKPTQFSHDSHWSKDGEIWGKTEQDLRSTQPRTRSPLQSPPFRVVNSSPGHSPASKHAPHTTNTTNTRYASHSPTLSGSETGSPTPSNPAVPSDNQATPNDGMIVNDQYVTMKRGATIMAVPEELEDYIDMNPNKLPKRGEVQSMYENVRRGEGNSPEDDFYCVPRSHTGLPSDTSSSDGDSSRPGSATRNRLALPPRDQSARSPDMDKRSLTLPAISKRVPSQYSVASKVASKLTSAGSKELLTDSPTGALSPTRIRYLPTALPMSNAASAEPVSLSVKFHASSGDVRQMEQREEATGNIQRSPVRPRPKPRQSIGNKVQRSASAASPDISVSGARKLSVPELTLVDPELRLTKAVKGVSLHRDHNHIAHPEDMDPLLPPPLPNRTYRTSTTHDKELQTAHTASEHPAYPTNHLTHFYNPLVEEFPDAAPELCCRALETHGHDLAKAREEIQIQILLGMKIPYTNADDCRRALRHCQSKIDRAASWLVERSRDLEQRKT